MTGKADFTAEEWELVREGPHERGLHAAQARTVEQLPALAVGRAERDLGNCCEDNAVALAHLRFADEYDRRAAEPVARAVESAS